MSGLELPYCSKCGFANDKEAIYCRKCGIAISLVTTVSSASTKASVPTVKKPRSPQICSICHLPKAGHKCSMMRCIGSSVCELKDRHPEEKIMSLSQQSDNTNNRNSWWYYSFNISSTRESFCICNNFTVGCTNNPHSFLYVKILKYHNFHIANINTTIVAAVQAQRTQRMEKTDRNLSDIIEISGFLKRKYADLFEGNANFSWSFNIIGDQGSYYAYKIASTALTQINALQEGKKRGKTLNVEIPIPHLLLFEGTNTISPTKSLTNTPAIAQSPADEVSVAYSVTISEEQPTQMKQESQKSWYRYWEL